MRGEPEPHYAQVNKRPRDMDRVADDNRSVGSHHSRHSERAGRGDDHYRKTPRRADELNVSTNLVRLQNSATFTTNRVTFMSFSLHYFKHLKRRINTWF